MNNFYGKLAQKLEEDVVRRDDVLEDFEAWDSLTALSIVAMVDEEYGVTIHSGDLLQIETAGDLEDLVTARCGANV